MRMDQYIGLNEWARKMVLKRHKVREFGTRVYASGKRVSFSRWARVPAARRQVVGKITGAWNPNVAALYRYSLPGGKVLEEFVQSTPWSGGPCYFIALKDVASGKPVPQSLWSDEELANA